MEQKKETNAQLKRRINNALVLVERTKESKEIYFDDKGLRLMYNEDYAVVGTGFHSHVFERVTPSGISKPYVFVKNFVDTAFENDCTVTDENNNKLGYSYAKLMQTMKDKKDDENAYNICWFTDLWFFNIFQPLYTIDETFVSTTLVYEQYVHNIACNSILLAEHKEDMTNKQYIQRVLDAVKEYTSNINDEILFHAMTDEQFVDSLRTNELEMDLSNTEKDDSKG